MQLLRTCWQTGKLIFFGLAVLLQSPVHAELQAGLVPRVIISFYDGQLGDSLKFAVTHQSAEMPLNHLGLRVRNQDIQDELPSREAMADVRGILLWMPSDSVPDPDRFLRWLIEQMEEGKPVVVMGYYAFERSNKGIEANPELVRKFWHLLGLDKAPDWLTVTYNIDIQSLNTDLTEFEHSFMVLPPAFPLVRTVPGLATSYLRAVRKGRSEILADLVTIGPKGSYVAPGYARVFSSDEEHKYWYINPFRFFSLAFHAEDIPKPDTTTLSGRRIFYSHIDGDGWRNLTLVPGYREDKKLSTEVILREVLLKYPDLPVTVAPIAGDLDLGWFGTKKTRKLASEIFALPYIEAGSHAFTHPINWEFFEHYNPEYEKPFLEQYPVVHGNYRLMSGFAGLLQHSIEHMATPPDSWRASEINNGIKKLSSEEKHYEAPRVYYRGPYDLDQDIQGSIDVIQALLPEGKRVEVFQWSGDTTPFPEAIKKTREAGVRNINGGDTRFDPEFDSLNWVSPIGRETGGERQIYASASNENTYTDNWTDRYYGLGYLIKTLKRTETPIRLKPINVYYHMYSGERLASLNALKENLDYAQSIPLAPITASQFAGIADGFYTTQFELIGERTWRILERGQLQTIRFDRAVFDGVDFSKSEGVIGQMHLHGSLYVALDPKCITPVISLATIPTSDREPQAERPYLINGRWWTAGYKKLDGGFQFQVYGFGVGKMSWYIPKPGRYRIIIKHTDGRSREFLSDVGNDRWLDIALTSAPLQPATIKVELERGRNAGS